MDDDLVLNISAAAPAGSKKQNNVKKGGRWTDRLKAKRVAKRKTRPEERQTTKAHGAALDDDEGDVRPPPPKRARKEQFGALGTSATPAAPKSRQPTQIISSLFSSNPRIEKPDTPSISRLSKPSNAPLDTSTFTGLGLNPLLISHLTTKMSISKPTSIQRAALPALLDTSSPETQLRDVFIQSQTGSGKTLSFLLPIIQDLLPLSSHSWIDRSIGTLAVIIAPTRELAKQISDVLETVLKLRLRPDDDQAEEASSARMTRWLVSGLLTGGSTRAHEKARLRKGLPILVSTPGRLLDHLQNTSSFNVGKCRWLVLDEADRLMELGFEETIKGIVKGLDGRRGLAMQAAQEGKGTEVGGWDWSRQRRTILCSATIRDDVQKLAGTTLVNPLVIKPTEADKPQDIVASGNADATSSEKFTPPSQLSQRYVVVPLKLRLVALVALLRSILAQNQGGGRGSKIIVFLSCTDSVDFHWKLLGSSSMGGEDDEKSRSDEEEDDGDDDEKEDQDEDDEEEKLETKSPLLPDTSIFRLHGSLPLQTRMASLKGFSTLPSTSTKPTKSKALSTSQNSILLCTSVASRGLDLPLVRAVIQYDLPTEGGATEYVHRVGRTARVGKGGEAWSFVAPSESEWVKWVEGRMRGGEKEEEGEKGIKLEQRGIDDVLSKGFGGKGTEYEERATEVQLAFERWVLRGKDHAELARKAFQSHMRAYATHPSDEKHIFHIRHLHLGHLAKAFALRDAPGSVSSKQGSKKSHGKTHSQARVKSKLKDRSTRSSRRNDEDSDSDYVRGGKGVNEAERRMKEAVRSQGRLIKKGGVMMSTGTGEFQIAGGGALERLVNAKM